MSRARTPTEAHWKALELLAGPHGTLSVAAPELRRSHRRRLLALGWIVQRQDLAVRPDGTAYYQLTAQGIKARNRGRARYNASKLKAAPNLGPGLVAAVDKGFAALAPCAGRAMSARQIAVLKLCLKNKNGRTIMRGVGVGLPTSEALVRAGRAVWGKPHETPHHGNLKTIEITDKGRLDLFMALGPIPELNGWTPPKPAPWSAANPDQILADIRTLTPAEPDPPGSMIQGKTREDWRDAFARVLQDHFTLNEARRALFTNASSLHRQHEARMRGPKTPSPSMFDACRTADRELQRSAVAFVAALAANEGRPELAASIAELTKGIGA